MTKLLRNLPLLLLPLLLAAPARAQTHDLTLTTSLMPQLTPLTAGVIGDFGVRWRLGSVFGLAANGRAGYLAQSGAYPHEGMLAILVGPMAEWELGAWQLHTALQLTHVHNTALADWAMNPLANMAGDSSGSVAHRTGGEISVGVTWPELWRFTTWRLVLETDATAAILPTSELLAWTAGLRIGLGFQRLVPTVPLGSAATGSLAASGR